MADNSLRNQLLEMHDAVSALDAISSMIVVYDSDDRIAHVNKSCCYNTGFSRSELINTRVEERLLADGEIHRGYEDFDRKNHKPGLEMYTSRWNTSDGSTRIINWVNRGLYDAEGELACIIATGTDVTELRLGEERILMNAEQQETLNNLMHIGMENATLHEKMLRCLQGLTLASWTGSQAETAMFMVDGNGKNIELIAQHDTLPDNRNRLDDHEFARSLCSPATESGHIQFTGSWETGRHGCRKPWYSIPVKNKENQVEAVAVLWLESGHEQDLGEIVFLHTISNTIASIIGRHRTDTNLKKTKQSLQTAQRIADMGSWELDIGKKRLTLSNQAIKILRSDACPAPDSLDEFYRLIWDEDAETLARMIDNAIVNHDHIETRLRINPDIDERTLILKGESYTDNDSGARKLIGTVQDITRQLQIEREQKLISNVFEGAHESIIVLDSSNRIDRVNRAFCNITGYTEDDVMGKYIDLLRPEIADERSYNEMWSTVEHNGSWCGEVKSRKKNGDTFSEWRTVSTVRNSHGDVERYLVLSMDLSAIKQSEERIHQLVYYDALTQLPNKSMFKSVLAEAVNDADATHHHLAVLTLGIDGLVRINDSMGHSSGDRMLNIMADRLRQCVRTRDTVCRWGGDEFVMLLTDIKQMEYAVGVASKVLNKLVEPITLGDNEGIVMGASIGISMYPVHGRDAIALIQNADVAMHRAKSEGGNRYHVYSDEMNSEAIARLSLESGLRRALDEHQLVLHYQPLVQLSNNRIVNAEALLRWNHPDKGTIPPDKFIPVAEESGLIIPIGEWVIHEACRQCADWQRNGDADIGVSINLSPRQFYDTRLIQIVRDAIDESGLSPSSIMLELTESSIMDSANQTIEYLHKLKETGIRLSVDDFGTGYSSLAYLKRFPIDKLKIDRSFVMNLDTNAEDRAIVQTVIAMGHTLNLDIVAEGVEKKEHMQYLKSQHCELAQGYFISRPIDISSFQAFIRRYPADAGSENDDPQKSLKIM